MTTLQEIKAQLTQERGRSAWRRGVINYAWELVGNIEMTTNYLGLNETEEMSIAEIKKAMFNGADTWSDYSWGGCSLIYNYQIAEALCSPSELKRTDGGRLKPNKQEEWLDTQARALFQASELILSIARGCRA